MRWPQGERRSGYRELLQTEQHSVGAFRMKPYGMERIFTPSVVARSLFGPAKRRCSRLAGSENRYHRTHDQL